MSRRKITQVLVGAGSGDAITSMARSVRRALETDFDSAIHAHYIPADMAGEIRPLAELAPGRRNDVIIYHASYGAPEVTSALLARTERLVLVYHNITPSIYFLAHEPAFAAGLQWGRHELGLIRNRTELAIADSSFNAHELEELGYDDVHVVPAGLQPSRLRRVAPDGELAHHLVERFPAGYVMSVSQLLPHKQFETLVGAMHLVQWVLDRGLGLVIVGAHRMPRYAEALQRHAQALNVRNAWFPGSVPESWLATFFRMARMNVTTSVHEGLALPPLEAMSFGVPVIARSAGALPETIGDAGILLPLDAGPMLLAEAIAELDQNEALRCDLVSRGLRRVTNLEDSDPVAQFVRLLGRVL